MAEQKLSAVERLRRSRISETLKGRVVSDETRRKISLALKGRPCTNPWTAASRKKVSTTLKRMNRPSPKWWLGKHLSEEHKQKLSLAHKGKPPAHGWSKAVRRKLSKTLKGHPGYMKGRIHSEEAKRKISLSLLGRPGGMKGKKASKETRKKQSAAMKAKNVGKCRTLEMREWMSTVKLKWWGDLPLGVRQKQIGRLTNAHPLNFGNKLELKLDAILSRLFPGQFLLNVNKISVGTKIPDFFGVRSKIVVEAFGRYWHGQSVTGRSRRQEELQKIRYFNKYGFKTVVIWEGAMSDELVVQKIQPLLGEQHITVEKEDGHAKILKKE